MVVVDIREIVGVAMGAVMEEVMVSEEEDPKATSCQ